MTTAEEAAHLLAYSPIHLVQFWRTCTNVSREVRQLAIREVIAACNAELDDCERDTDLPQLEIVREGPFEIGEVAGILRSHLDGRTD